MLTNKSLKHNLSLIVQFKILTFIQLVENQKLEMGKATHRQIFFTNSSTLQIKYNRTNKKRDPRYKTSLETSLLKDIQLKLSQFKAIIHLTIQLKISYQNKLPSKLILRN